LSGSQDYVTSTYESQQKPKVIKAEDLLDVYSLILPILEFKLHDVCGGILNVTFDKGHREYERKITTRQQEIVVF